MTDPLCLSVDADVDIGIAPDARAAIAGGLARVLADTYGVYLKTHNFHWNVTGPMFASLHQLFETQYTELALAVDEVAERIRALGAFAPGSHGAFRALTRIVEPNGVPDAMAMLAQLTRDHETVGDTARAVIPLADAADDAPTVDLLTERLRAHEKAAWMLRAHRA